MPVLSYRHTPALTPPQIFLHTPYVTECQVSRVSWCKTVRMSDKAADPVLHHHPTGSLCPVPDCPEPHDSAALPGRERLEDHELRDLVSRALVGLAARPLSMTIGHLTQDQVAIVCRALDVDPRPVVQLSIVAARGGAQLVVWSHE